MHPRRAAPTTADAVSPATRPTPVDLGPYARAVHAGALWQDVLVAAEATLDEPPYTPATQAPWRKGHEADANNREYRIVGRSANRVLRHAVVFDHTGDRRHLDAAWRQIEALFDDQRWPEWRDEAHLGNIIDIRVGDLARALAQAYVRVRDDLTDAQRAAFIDGVDRKIAAPFFAAVEADDWVLRAGHNWTTRIVGGVGMIGAALLGEHPQAARMVEISDPVMFGLIDHLGVDGSFNEAPGYAASLGSLAEYVTFRRRTDPALGPAAREALGRLRASARWHAHVTLPGGRLMAFGDTWPRKHSGAAYAAAVASASDDGLAQWLYLYHREADSAQDDYPASDVNPREMGHFDPAVEPAHPREVLPRAVAFREHDGILVSRTGWDLTADSDDVIVYGKSGRVGSHGDHDAGTLAVDRGPLRLIRDLGTLSYPSDYFGPDRPRYYNDSPFGHNVVTFGDFADDPLGGMKPDGRGELLDLEFDEKTTRCSLDLSDAYRDGRRVTRRVLHVLPGVVAVMDEATPDGNERVGLRWHLAELATVGDDGSFSFAHGGVPVAGLVASLGGPGTSTATGRHAYAPPFDTDRAGRKLERKREPFVEVTTMTDGPVRWLTILAVGEPGGELPAIRRDGETFVIGVPGPIRLECRDGELIVAE